MLLDRVHITVATVPLPEAVPMAFGSLGARTLVLVEVEADGVRGVGEAWANHPPWAGTERVTTLEQGVVPMLAGRDVAEPARVQRELLSGLSGAARQSGAEGPMWQALSAVDIALWDLLGRATGEQVARLLAPDGVALRAEVPGYGSGLGPTDVESGCRRAAGAGFRAVKARVGFGRARDEATLALARERLGADVTLLADANQAWTTAEAVEFCRWSRRYRLGWLEEPVRGNDLDDLVDLAPQAGIGLACGENLYGPDDYLRFAGSGAVRVLQPDLSKNGGFTVAREVARRLPEGVVLAPHCYGSAVVTAASVAFAAGHREAEMVEDDIRSNPLRDALLTVPLEVKEGMFVAPGGPGLGVDVDWDAVEPHIVTRKVCELGGLG